MSNLQMYEERREQLTKLYLAREEPSSDSVATGGVHHLALICSNIEATIRFYTEVMGMRLSRIVQNRDEPTSTHIFLDMGGGNQLAFFDFPEMGQHSTVRGIGSMHHVALKAEPAQYRRILRTLKERKIAYSLHGTEEAGSVYLRDPDDILLEITSGLYGD